MTARLALAAFVAVLVAAAPAGAQDPPPPPDPEPVVPAGVTVAGVDLAGMTAAEAGAALQAFFDRPLAFTLQGKPRSVRPAVLRARSRVGRAVDAALLAAPDTALALDVRVRTRPLQRWLRRLARTYNRAAVSTRAVLRDLRPRLTRARPGRTLRQLPARRELARALRRHVRDVGALPVRTIRAKVKPSTFGRVVVIRRGSKLLTLYRPAGAGPMRARAHFRVATGMAAYPTPVGNFRIVTKQRNPWWYPPSAGWAAGASPIPPGPGNPLGTRWMGLNVGAVGIHGTPDAASIGYSASHGCIRMVISQAEWLFERVSVGTPVFIRAA